MFTQAWIENWFSVDLTKKEKNKLGRSDLPGKSFCEMFSIEATFVHLFRLRNHFKRNRLNNGAILTLKAIKSWKWKREACKQHMPGWGKKTRSIAKIYDRKLIRSVVRGEDDVCFEEWSSLCIQLSDGVWKMWLLHKHWLDATTVNLLHFLQPYTS